MANVFFSSGFGRLLFLIHIVSGFQIVGLVSFSRSFQFSFLPLVKVLVNLGLRLFGIFLSQVILAKVLFFGFVRGWFL